MYFFVKLNYLHLKFPAATLSRPIPSKNTAEPRNTGASKLGTLITRETGAGKTSCALFWWEHLCWRIVCTSWNVTDVFGFQYCSLYLCRCWQSTRQVEMRGDANIACFYSQDGLCRKARTARMHTHTRIRSRIRMHNVVYSL